MIDVFSWKTLSTIVCIGLVVWANRSCSMKQDKPSCQQILDSDLLAGTNNPLVQLEEDGGLYVLDHDNWRVFQFDQNGEVVNRYDLPQDLLTATGPLSFGLQDERFIIASSKGIYSFGGNPQVQYLEIMPDSTDEDIMIIPCSINLPYHYGDISADGTIFVCVHGLNNINTTIVRYSSPTEWNSLYSIGHGWGFRVIQAGWDNYLYIQHLFGDIVKLDEAGAVIDKLNSYNLPGDSSYGVLIGVDADSNLYFEMSGSTEHAARLTKLASDGQLIWERDLEHHNLDIWRGFIDASGSYYYWERTALSDDIKPILMKCDY